MKRLILPIAVNNKTMKNLYIIVFIMFHSIVLPAQSCIFFYENGYQGDSDTLTIGASIEVESSLMNLIYPSFKVDEGAAIHLKNHAPYTGSYGVWQIYSEESSEGIGGGDYDNFKIAKYNVSCKESNNLPQPEVLIPIDLSNVNISNTSCSYDILSPNDTVLVIRKAFMWANSEDEDCPHGPYGSISVNIHYPDLLYDYGFDMVEISKDYCGSTDPNEDCGPFRDNSCTDDNKGCYAFLNNYPTIPGCNGIKLPGPIYFETNECGAGFLPDPKSEWIDGPWGACYSNVGILNWNNISGNLNEVALVLREGDDCTCDDFMGAILVNKNMSGPIWFKAWYFGWIVLENIIVPPSGQEESIDIADYYWYYDWDGSYPDDDGVYNQSNIFDQYLPLSNQSIIQMESNFQSGTTIGLMGGKLPAGILDKPMIYVAPCEPAIFDNN